MTKKDLLIIQNDSSDQLLTLQQLCDLCGIEVALVNDFIEYAIVQPKGKSQAEWTFDGIQLRRVKIVLRLQRDLEVNLAGAALVLDLLDELQQMRAEAELLEKRFLKL